MNFGSGVWVTAGRAPGAWADERHGMVGQFRQPVLGRLGGYGDMNDADRLGLDPAI